MSHSDFRMLWHIHYIIYTYTEAKNNLNFSDQQHLSQHYS